MGYSNDTIRAYLDRHLAAGEEQGFEEAMLGDEALADAVQAEMALRRGFKELARREPAAAPRQAAHPIAAAAVPHAAHAVRAGRTPRWLGYAAAAAVFAFAAVPTYLTLLNRQDTAALEARLSARIDASGEQAAYALPASLVTDAPASAEPDAQAPVRIRLPAGVSEVALELPATDLATARRLTLVNSRDSNLQFTLAGQPLAEAQAVGFNVGANALPPGRYHVTVERDEAGTWVVDRRFVLNIDGPR